MTTKVAACRCGQLSATVDGEPTRISVCHCRSCQKRTGGPFAAQARYPTTTVAISGESRVWERVGESGLRASFHWCPVCGGDVFYTSEGMPTDIAIPIGAFAPGDLPQPTVTVFEEQKESWLTLSPTLRRET